MPVDRRTRAADTNASRCGFGGSRAGISADRRALVARTDSTAIKYLPSQRGHKRTSTSCCAAACSGRRGDPTIILYRQLGQSRLRREPLAHAPDIPLPTHCAFCRLLQLRSTRRSRGKASAQLADGTPSRSSCRAKDDDRYPRRLELHEVLFAPPMMRVAPVTAAVLSHSLDWELIGSASWRWLWYRWPRGRYASLAAVLPGRETKP